MPSPSETSLASPKFRPGQIWPDTNGVAINAHGGGILFHDGVYYWFGEHKTAGSRSGVAVADAATGPYRYLGSVRPDAGVWPDNAPSEQCRPLSAEERTALDGLDLPGGPLPYYPKHLLFRRDFEGGQMARDMTLFVDDDGIAYHVYSSEANGTLHISQLRDDYLSHAGKYVRVLPGRFNEAPAMMKWRGQYFLFTSDCTGWAPNPARLLRADSIWGPWEELGNPCLGPGHLITNTFESQVTFILPVPGREDAFIFMADRWRPENAIDGRYVWLPIHFRHGVPVIEWREAWDPGDLPAQNVPAGSM